MTAPRANPQGLAEEPVIPSGIPATRFTNSAWLPWLLLWCLWAGWSFSRVPVPGIDEPHYLGKAKHFWDAAWCPGDFFLDSANPHQVFYAVFGWPSRFLSLEHTAWLGRGAALAVVAAGWIALSRALLGSRWAGVAAGIVFLFLQSLGNWSGEWVIGGIESRVIAYGLLFWALAFWIENKLVRAAILLGLAVSFHPVIGSWGLVSVVLSLVLRQIVPAFSFAANDSPHASGFETIRSWAPPVIICVLCALPGLIPAVEMLRISDKEAALFADQLQVGDRLRHHLDPMTFPVSATRYLGMQLALIWLLSREVRGDRRFKQWGALLVAALLIALAGVVIGWGPRPLPQMPGWEWRVRLLKFYPFRFADLLVPATLSLVVAARGLEAWREKAGRAWLECGLLAALGLAWIVPFADSRPSRLPGHEQRALVEAYEWMAGHSAPDALCQSLDVDWGLRWHAERAEFVSYKDMPQDAASLKVWYDRLWMMSKWKQSADDDSRLTRAELVALREQTGIQFLVVRRAIIGRLHTREFEMDPAYQNDQFAVLLLPAADLK